VLKLGHPVPREAALRRPQVQAVDGGVHHLLATEAVRPDVGHGVRVRITRRIGSSAEAMVAGAMVLPGDKVRLGGLKIEVGVVEGVVGDLPEWVDVLIAGPEPRGKGVESPLGAWRGRHGTGS
jgi:hypothetical protein